MSFYPPGWDYERVMNASNEEFATLTKDQHMALFNGLQEAGLYQAFEDKIHQRVMEAMEAQRLAEEATKTDEQKFADREICAPYIDTLKNVFKFDPDWSEWGFVVFRATAYGPEADAQWAEFRRRWGQIIEEGHADQRGFHPKSGLAMKLLRFQWVEDPVLEGASPMKVSQHFNEMWRDLPTGLATSACLMVTPEVLRSVLNAPLPSFAPLQERKEIPYVVAVSRVAHCPPSDLSPGGEGEDVFGYGFKGHFNVAVESLLNELNPLVSLDIQDLPRLAIDMRHDKDIWCESGRGGVRQYVKESS